MIFADAISPVVHLHPLLTDWQTDWLSFVSLAIEIAFALGYVVFTRRLAARGRKWSPWRTTSFLLGILTIVIAVQSGLASYDDSVFNIHVIQHLMLMNVAPILLALGAPVTLVLQAGERRTQERVLKVLHNRVVEVITNPVFVLVLFSATMVGYFLTPFYQFSLEHPLIHDLTHLHFLIAGCLYWWLVVGIDPSRWRLSYPMKLGFLAVDIPVGTLLGLGLTQSRISIAPLFHSLGDTHAGGRRCGSWGRSSPSWPWASWSSSGCEPTSERRHAPIGEPMPSPPEPSPTWHRPASPRHRSLVLRWLHPKAPGSD